MSFLPPLSKLQAFIAVAETLNFRRAAERLNIAQPALSRSIKQLEEQLGFELFERSTRRVTLTRAGNHLFAEANASMMRLARAFENAREIATGTRGRIMVAYNSFAATGPMSDIIIQFRKQYPHCEVNLNLLSSGEQRDGLISGTIDLGFIISDACSPPLAGFLISREPLVALAPGNHGWAARKSISLKELSTEAFVAGSRARWGTFLPIMHGLFERKGLVVTVREEADDLPLLLQLVRTGMGCTILNASCKLTLPPDIHVMEIEDADATLDVNLAWHDENLSILASRFTDLARKALASAA